MKRNLILIGTLLAIGGVVYVMYRKISPANRMDPITAERYQMALEARGWYA